CARPAPWGPPPTGHLLRTESTALAGASSPRAEPPEAGRRDRRPVAAPCDPSAPRGDPRGAPRRAPCFLERAANRDPPPSDEPRLHLGATRSSVRRGPRKRARA